MDLNENDELIQVMIVFCSKYIRLKVKRSDRIESLKSRIQRLEGIHPQHMTLLKSIEPKIELEGNNTLAHYCISSGSFLYLQVTHVQTDTEMLIEEDELREELMEDSACMYHISVLLGSGEILSLDVHSCNTVRDVKLMIQDLSGIPPHQQKIFCAENELANRFTLEDYSILEGSMLHLDFNPELMKIYVKTLMEGKTICLEVNRSYSVGMIKAMLEEEEGIPMHLQMLYCDGKELIDDVNLADSNLKNGLTVYLALASYIGPMQIHVKTVDGYTISMEVSASCTIGNIKTKLETEVPGVRPYLMKLVYQGKELENRYTLDEYNVHKDSILSLFIIQRGVLEFIVKDFTGRTILNLKVQSSETVSFVKAQIQDKEGIPAQQQLLLFDGKQLVDDKTIASCYIMSGSTVYLFPLSRGKVQFLIKMPEKSRLIEAESSDTIGNLKARIRSMESIPPSKQIKLVMEGKELNNCSKCADYNICWNSVLHVELGPGSRGLMCITIKSEVGRTTMYQTVEKSTTVGQLRKKIWEAEGFCLNGRSLAFKGKLLDDCGTLGDDYSIRDKSTVHLGRLRCHGGKT